MKDLFKLQLRSYTVLRQNLNKFIGYQLITGSVLMLILLPGFRLVFNLLMKSSGMSYITNGLLKKFLISPQGIILALFSLIIGYLVVMIQLGGQIVLSHQVIVTKEENRYIDILIYTFKRLKYMFGLDGVIIVFYFVLLAPLFDSNIQASLLGDIEIPGFIMQVIESNILYSSLLILFVSVMVYFIIRWIFALHVLLLDMDIDKRFLKRSNLIRKSHGKTLFTFLITDILLGLLILIVITLTVILISFVILLIPGLSETTQIMLIFSLAMTIFLGLSVISVPLSVIQLTLLYHKLTGNEERLNIKVHQNKSLLNKFLSNKFVISLTLLIVLSLSFSYMYYFMEVLDYTKYSVGITAHRGSSFEAPENTLVSIEKAIQNGASHVEIDVQMTGDHHIILLHDETFERTSNDERRPDQMTLHEVKTLEAGAWFDEEFAGEPVPTLQEVIDFTRGKIILNIEIKGSKYSPDIHQVLVNLLEKNKLSQGCVVTSLEYDDLLTIESLKTEIKTGYIMFVALGNLEDLQVDFYSVEASNVSEDFVSRAHSLGREVHVWTINEIEDMEEMLEFGVDNIITDYDYELYKLINHKTSN